MLPRPIKQYLKTAKERIAALQESSSYSVKEYWGRHTVTHHPCHSREESLHFLKWRNNHCLFDDEMMLYTGHDSSAVLDFGCGIGHDLVGFLEYSIPSSVIGIDISKKALEYARQRILFHPNNERVQLVHREDERKLPLQSESIDYIHSTGVIHHCEYVKDLLGEFYRVLKPGGRARVMVYNYHSIWLHLYVAYERQILKKIDSRFSLLEAFRRSTDGPQCPISRCFTKKEFCLLGGTTGFETHWLGSSVSLKELLLLPLRLHALDDIRLQDEQRNFLKQVTFDSFGRPCYRGDVAGINGYYEPKKN